jgi:hypothetical protein
MKAWPHFSWRASLAVSVLALSACGYKSVGSATDPTMGTAPGSVAAAQPSQRILTGHLVLFGAEMDAWLGLRDDAGRVTRLVFNSREEFARQRLLQNQKVRVLGAPLPTYLGRLQLNVTAIEVQP